MAGRGRAPQVSTQESLRRKEHQRAPDPSRSDAQGKGAAVLRLTRGLPEARTAEGRREGRLRRPGKVRAAVRARAGRDDRPEEPQEGEGGQGRSPLRSLKRMRADRDDRPEESQGGGQGPTPPRSLRRVRASRDSRPEEPREGEGGQGLCPSGASGG